MNLKKGINPHTKRTFIVLSQDNQYLGNYQTRNGAIANRPTKGKVYEAGNLVTYFYNQKVNSAAKKFGKGFNPLAVPKATIDIWKESARKLVANILVNIK